MEYRSAKSVRSGLPHTQYHAVHGTKATYGFVEECNAFTLRREENKMSSRARFATGMIAGLVLGSALMATAQSGFYYDVTGWRPLPEAAHLGYVAGTLDTVTVLAFFQRTADPSGVIRPDVGTLAATIQRCMARAQLRTLGDTGAFAERAMGQKGAAGVAVAATILAAMTECGK
jgi:hypothetical protein